MITDSIENAKLYNLEVLEEVFNFIDNYDFSKATIGRHDVKGDKIFYMIQERSTNKVEATFWESHRKYIDIHYIIEGEEVICFVRGRNLEITENYIEDKDLILYKHTGAELINPILVREGEFMVLYPEEAHMTNIYKNGKSAFVRKAIFKIAIS